MKAYLAVHPTPNSYNRTFINLIKGMRNELENLRVYAPVLGDSSQSDGYYTFLNNAEQVLSSQILIVDFSTDVVDKLVAQDIGLFVGSLETLKALNVRHSPKLIIGLVNKIEPKYESPIIGAVQEWGCLVDTPEKVIKAVEEFMIDYPR